MGLNLNKKSSNQNKSKTKVHPSLKIKPNSTSSSFSSNSNNMHHHSNNSMISKIKKSLWDLKGRFLRIRFSCTIPTKVWRPPHEVSPETTLISLQVTKMVITLCGGTRQACCPVKTTLNQQVAVPWFIKLNQIMQTWHQIGKTTPRAASVLSSPWKYHY